MQNHPVFECLIQFWNGCFNYWTCLFIFYPRQSLQKHRNDKENGSKRSQANFKNIRSKPDKFGYANTFAGMSTF